MLYVMIAIRYPFGFDSGPGCSTTEQVRRRICNIAPKPNSDFQFTPAQKFASEDLRALLCGMLTVNAPQRMTLGRVQASNWVRTGLPRPQDQEPTLYPERPPLELGVTDPAAVEAEEENDDDHDGFFGVEE